MTSVNLHIRKRSHSSNKLPNTLLYEVYVGDAFIGGNCSKSPTVITHLLANASYYEQRNISHNLLWMCNIFIFGTIDISSIIINSTSE